MAHILRLSYLVFTPGLMIDKREYLKFNSRAIINPRVFGRSTMLGKLPTLDFGEEELFASSFYF